MDEIGFPAIAFGGRSASYLGRSDRRSESAVLMDRDLIEPTSNANNSEIIKYFYFIPKNWKGFVMLLIPEVFGKSQTLSSHSPGTLPEDEIVMT